MANTQLGAPAAVWQKKEVNHKQVVLPGRNQGGGDDSASKLIQLLLNQCALGSGLPKLRSGLKAGESELMQMSDLPGLGSSPGDLRAAIKNIFDTDPDGICVNSETQFDAVTPAITLTYGYPCHKILGNYTYYNKDVDNDGQTAIGGSNYAYNYSSAPATISVAVSGSFGEETSWSSEITAGMTWSASVGLEGILSIGGSFSVSVTAGKSHTDTHSQTVTQTAQVDVPPGKKCKVSITAVMKSESMDYRVPIEVDGWFGSNFSWAVQGHYYHFNYCSSVLPRTSGELHGHIKCVRAVDTQTIIGAFEDI